MNRLAGLLVDAQRTLADPRGDILEDPPVDVRENRLAGPLVDRPKDAQVDRLAELLVDMAVGVLMRTLVHRLMGPFADPLASTSCPEIYPAPAIARRHLVYRATR